MGKNINFLFVGVGGQGIVLAGDIVGDVGLRAGFDVKKCEIHGMAQRGGSVESHVRWGDKVYGPTVGQGEADYVIALEQLEAARWASYAAPKGVVMINNQKIAPLSVNTGNGKYPETEAIKGIYAPREAKIHMIEGLAEARKLGNPAVTGVIMLGYLSSMLPQDEKIWLDVISERVPAKFFNLNKEAFLIGRKLGAANK
jgi:indolepyruvate ferredoxin oxidoreductase beta subunit